MQVKVNLSGVNETMLQTVYARAKETKRQRGFLNDTKALELIDKLDYDFTKADHDQTMETGVIARTILLDKLVKEYLDNHQDVTVINIACGLDTRCYRVSDYRHWYNLDLENVINVRNTLLEDSDKITSISASAMDEKWPSLIKDKENVLVIIEGLSMYLNEKDILKIFKLIHDNFKDVTVFVEVMNPWVVKHVKEKSIGAKFTWGVKNGQELEKLIPDFKPLADYSLCEGMKVFIPIYKLLSKISFIANISNKIVVLKYK